MEEYGLSQFKLCGVVSGGFVEGLRCTYISWLLECGEY
jgi:hypothetical protein